MNERECHRQLLDACKLLLARFERNCAIYRRGPTSDDYWYITKAFRAIENSKAVLEIGSHARMKVNEI